MEKEEEHCFDISFLKGKPMIIIIKLAGGWGYVSTPLLSFSESEKPLYHNHSSGISSCELDDSVDNIFKDLSVNMISTSHPKDGDEKMIQSDTDPWIKH